MNIQGREHEFPREFVKLVKSKYKDVEKATKIEKVLVRNPKTAKTKEIVVDAQANLMKFNKIRKMTDKNSCMDMFKDVKIDDVGLFEDKTFKNYLTFKMNNNYLLDQYEKLNLIINFRAVRGLTFLKLLLKRLEMAKELFVLNIEQGDEVYIMKDLS